MEKKTETEETVTPRSLETVRLLIRPFQEEDADAFFACCQNPNLGNNAGWAPHKTIEESRKILQDVFIGQENIWAMILKDAQQLIGSIGIVPDPKRENPQVRMLGYWLDEAHWGKGYMTESVQGVLKYGFEKYGNIRQQDVRLKNWNGILPLQNDKLADSENINENSSEGGEGYAE